MKRKVSKSKMERILAADKRIAAPPNFKVTTSLNAEFLPRAYICNETQK